MSHYELATLDTAIFGAAKVAPHVQDWCASGGGRLLGAWATDIGALNRVLVLRGFDSRDALLDERERALRAADPWNCSAELLGLSMESYRGLDFLPPVATGAQGPVYEFRTYRLKIHGLMPTMERWEGAIPERTAYSRLTVAMYGLDGAPRLTQIWPYPSLEARAKARAQSVADGKWPPKGGPDFLTPDMTSQIAMPLPFSPLK